MILPDDEFTFTLTLSDNSINGENGDFTFEDGIASFTLKDGETKTTDELPDGTTYTVEETEPDADKYEIEEKSQSGTVSGKTEAKFENKRVSGIIRITTTPNENGTGMKDGSMLNYRIGGWTYPPIPEGKTTDGALVKDDGYIYLSVPISGSTEFHVPVGTLFSMDTSSNTIETADGRTVSNDAKSGNIKSGISSTDMSKVKKGETKEITIEEIMANYGVFTISKTVAGAGADQSKQFEFDVTLDVSDVDDRFVDKILAPDCVKYPNQIPWGTKLNSTLDFRNGNTQTLKLSHNQSDDHAFYYNSKITISEKAESSEGYTPSVSSPNTSTLASGNDGAFITNTKNADTLSASPAKARSKAATNNTWTFDLTFEPADDDTEDTDSDDE